jgi:hypothetical protein
MSRREYRTCGATRNSRRDSSRLHHRCDLSLWIFVHIADDRASCRKPRRRLHSKPAQLSLLARIAYNTATPCGQ